MSGTSAYGTLFGVSTALDMSTGLPTSTHTWDYIGELTGIGGPSITGDTIDVTTHDSTDAYRSFVAGLLDGGDISLEGNLMTAGAGDEMLSLAEARAVVCYRVKFPVSAGSTGMDWLFGGILNTFETDAPHDGKISFSAGVKLTAKPVLTSTYSTA